MIPRIERTAITKPDLVKRASEFARRAELMQKRLSARESFLSQLPTERDTRFDNVLGNLAELSVIPRPSGNEREASEFVAERGSEYLSQGLISRMEVDSARNVTWDIPATSPEYDTMDGSTILQGHLDAVCKSVNPLKDPASSGIELEIVQSGDSFIIQSKDQETTAAVDNGLMAMYLLELPRLLSDLQIPHGRLKVIFTTGEESGLDGAKAYQGNLSNYANLINIDSEEERFITHGSAAIGFTHISLDLERSATPINEDVVYRTFKVSGLHGGHSGVTIADTVGENTTRQNAIHLAANMISRFAPSAQVSSVNAESELLNAIPSEATFILTLSRKSAQNLEVAAAEEELRIKDQGEKDTASITLLETDRPENVLTSESSEKVLGLLSTLPYGVPSESSNYQPDPNGSVVIQNRMKRADDGSFYEESELVPIQTATNLASALLEQESMTLSVGMMTRSSAETPETDLEGLRDEIGNIAKGFGAKVEQTEAEPAWKAVANSELSRIAQGVYMTQFPQRQPLQEIVTLGGLEVALFLERYPHLLGHIISIGPDIFGAHSVSEHSPYDSGERAFQYVLELVKVLGERGKESQQRQERTRRLILE